MKTKYISIGAAIFLLIGITITILSFETIPSDPPENLPEGMVPITPEVGKTSTPVGPYLSFASVLILIGTGIYSLIGFLKWRIRKWKLEFKPIGIYTYNRMFYQLHDEISICVSGW